MIRSRETVLLLSPISIDPTVENPLLDARGSQQEIDSESVATVEGSAAIVPPGEGLFLRELLPKEIMEPPFETCGQALALGLGMEDFALGCLAPPAVERRGADVEVPA